MNLISNYLRLFFVFLICILTTAVSKAQTGSNSPYSRYGIGDMVPEGFTVQSGMGGIGAAYSSPFQINFINPASYIADSNVVFDFGAKGEIRKLQSNAGKNTLNNATFSHFSLAFPVVKGKMSATFGLLPFSSVGYNVVDTKDTIGVDNLRYEYQGTGGYNKFYLGTGFRISRKLSAGINVAYLFGTVEQIKNVEFPAGLNYFNSRLVNATTAKGIYSNFGLLYESQTKKGLDIKAGFAGSLSAKVNAENNVFYYDYSISPVSGGEIVKDSVVNEQTSKGFIHLPEYFRGGLSVGKAQQWLAGLDFSYYNWSRYENFGASDNLGNNYMLAAGAERYYNKFALRAGLRYGTSYIQIRQTQLKEYAVSCGLSLKKSYSKKPPSSINLSVEAGSRGTTDNNLIKEGFIKLYLGFTLADVWFIKPKYD